MLAVSLLRYTTSLYYSIPKNWFYWCCLFLYFLLALKSQNQRMDEQLGVWCNFNIPWLDSLPHPLFLERWGNCPKFCQKKYDGTLTWQVVITKRLNTWKRENSFKRRIITLYFGENYTNLLLPVFSGMWRMRWDYRADYRLLWTITQ